MGDSYVVTPPWFARWRDRLLALWVAASMWGVAWEYLTRAGGGTPYRVRLRPPSFYVTGGLERIITGAMMADVVPCFGSLNMIGGECDH